MTLDIKRNQIWIEPLSDFFVENSTRPLVWNSWDCWTGLVLGAIEATTGENLRGDYLEEYEDEDGAAQFIRDRGFHNLGDYIGSLFKEIHPSEAESGDIAFIQSEEELGGVCAIYDGSLLVVLTDNGFGHVLRSRAARAFRVG